MTHPPGNMGDVGGTQDSGAVIVIPARLASTRLPEKPLLRETGKYLVQHTYERARQVAGVSAVVVATDHPRIFDAVRSFGGDAVMTSPGCATGTDRVAEAVRGRGEQWVVNVQGDEPEFDAGDVARLLASMRREPSLPMGTLATVADPEEMDRPSVVKVVTGLRGRALYFSRSRIPFDRDGGNAPPVRRHVGIYAFRRDALHAFAAMAPTPLEQAEKLEQLRALEHGWEILVVDGNRAPPGIDIREDYEAFVRRTGAPGAAARP